MANVFLWGDGSSDCRDRSGGWAFVIQEGKKLVCEGAGAVKDTTNNRMEMTAILKGLQEAFKRGYSAVEVRSDSSYLINCFRQEWHVKWRQNGWKNSQGKKVVNPDLWEKLLDLNDKIDVTWIHVKGHIGIPQNERCDVLAGQARLSSNSFYKEYE